MIWVRGLTWHWLPSGELGRGEVLGFAFRDVRVLDSRRYMTCRIGVSPYSKSNTEAVGGPHGVFGPAAIGTFDQKMYMIEQKCHMKLDRSFVQVKVCI